MSITIKIIHTTSFKGMMNFKRLFSTFMNLLVFLNFNLHSCIRKILWKMAIKLWKKWEPLGWYDHFDGNYGCMNWSHYHHKLQHTGAWLHSYFLHSSILLYSVWIHFYCGVFSTEFAHKKKILIQVLSPYSRILIAYLIRLPRGLDITE